MPSPDMLPIEGDDSPLPQPIDPIDALCESIASAATLFTQRAMDSAKVGDHVSAASFLDAACRAFVAIS